MPSSSPSRAAIVRATRSLDRVLVLERLDRGSLRGGVEIERLAHLVDRRRGTPRVPHSAYPTRSAGEPVDLGEGAQQHQVRPAPQQLEDANGSPSASANSQ